MTEQLDGLNMKALRKLAEARRVSVPFGISKEQLVALLQGDAPPTDAPPAGAGARQASSESSTPPTSDAPNEPEPTDEQAAKTETTSPPATGDRVEIARADRRSWWCPVCDFAHPHGTVRCTNCGATNTGEGEVTVGGAAH